MPELTQERLTEIEELNTFARKVVLSGDGTDMEAAMEKDMCELLTAYTEAEAAGFRKGIEAAIARLEAGAEYWEQASLEGFSEERRDTMADRFHLRAYILLSYASIVRALLPQEDSP